MKSKKIPYIVGDIHGCYNEYVELEKKILQHAETHQWSPLIISVGDLIDRGPESQQVVEHFIAGEKKLTHLAIMGNHEVEFTRFLHAFRPDLFTRANRHFPDYLFSIEEDFDSGRNGANICDSLEDFTELLLNSWLLQGGDETLKSYQANPDDPNSWNIPVQHLEFILNLPFYWEDDKLCVTHALATPSDYETVKKAAVGETKGFVLEKDFTEMKKLTPKSIKSAIHSLIWNRRRPMARLNHERVHISGHTPMDYVKVSKEYGFIQLDTGCVYGKRLTAYCQENDHYLTVKSETNWKNS